MSDSPSYLKHETIRHFSGGPQTYITSMHPTACLLSIREVSCCNFICGVLPEHWLSSCPFAMTIDYNMGSSFNMPFMMHYHCNRSRELWVHPSPADSIPLLLLYVFDHWTLLQITVSKVQREKAFNMG